MKMATPVDVISSEEFIAYLDNKLSPLFTRDSPITLLEVGCGAGAFAKIFQDKHKGKVCDKIMKKELLHSFNLKNDHFINCYYNEGCVQGN